MTSPDINELTAVVLEVERHVADLGWDQPSQVYALADTAELIAREPALASHIGDTAPGSLTPVEQEPLPAGRLDEVLAAIGWPPEVLGCVLVTELVVLPPSAEQETPYDERDIEIWAASHPERQDVRLAVGVTRDGQHASCLRVRGDDELVVDPDLADSLVDGLLATFH
ncbi:MULTISPECIES: PPA1309 family protein [unclassified Frankia]|uniref:PPA1309 family protein n=1 Tax=unclassified Frankia TaxID=2632575 RepID=UPI001EF491F4|nr:MULTISPECIES: PPA1309 family protein [unclassified Frankia]